jgi:hypothetical protein
MANKIAINYNAVSLLLSSMKLGTNQKSEIHNESKTVSGKTMILIQSDPRLAASLPSYRKNNIFILSN